MFQRGQLSKLSIVGRFSVGAGFGVQFLQLALEIFILAFKLHDLLLEICNNFIKLAQLVLHVGEVRLNSFFKVHIEIVSKGATKVK